MVEPAQPADRVPADRPTPPDGQPPVTPPAGEVRPAGETGEQPAPPPGREAIRAERTPKDMAISLLVLLVPIALIFGFYQVFLGGEQATVIDPSNAVNQARVANAFPISEPSGLSDDWRPVSASYRTVDGGATLRIGYLSPDGRGVQLVQSNVPPETLIPAELTPSGQPQGPTEIAGRAWQRYTARGNEQGLVLLEPDRTVIVVGDARDEELRELSASLG